MFKLIEFIAIIFVVGGLAGTNVFIDWYQNDYNISEFPKDAKIFDLTGVARNGIWTLDKVNGHNYWWEEFTPAQIHVDKGDEVVLRFQSADVTHRFYLPELNIGPVEVVPGHTEIVSFRAEKEGAFKYYCTSMCGDCHFYMQGWILVGPDAVIPVNDEKAACAHENVEELIPENMLEKGKFLYSNLGCMTCHGNDGIGGIENYNYAGGLIPAHANLAEKFFLEDEDEIDAFVDLLTHDIDLNSIDGIPEDIPQFRISLVQYNAAKELIRIGKHCAKLDENLAEPPLQMPSWDVWLPDNDIDAVIAYLLTLYDWDEDEYE